MVGGCSFVLFEWVVMYVWFFGWVFVLVFEFYYLFIEWCGVCVNCLWDVGVWVVWFYFECVDMGCELKDRGGEEDYGFF